MKHHPLPLDFVSSPPIALHFVTIILSAHLSSGQVIAGLVRIHHLKGAIAKQKKLFKPFRADIDRFSAFFSYQ